MKKSFDLKITKQIEEGEYYVFSGIASTSGLDRDNDIVSSDAYDSNINKEVPILFNHNTDLPLGITTSMKKDGDKLLITAKMPKDDEFVKSRVIPQMKVGSLKSLSIGFIPNFDKITYKNNVRIFDEIEIFETSLVTIPSNIHSKVTGLKKFELKDIKEIKSRREFESFLSDSNIFSKSVCTYLASLCKFQCETDAEIEAKKIDDILTMFK
jgi:HK97 family phage prohead protease